MGGVEFVEGVGEWNLGQGFKDGTAELILLLLTVPGDVVEWKGIWLTELGEGFRAGGTWLGVGGEGLGGKGAVLYSGL